MVAKSAKSWTKESVSRDIASLDSTKFIAKCILKNSKNISQIDGVLFEFKDYELQYTLLPRGWLIQVGTH
jgi:hypothetical protein